MDRPSKRAKRLPHGWRHSHSKQHRKRARRIAIPTAIAVLIAALAATWGLIQPEVERTAPAGHTLVTYIGNSFTGGSLMDSGPAHRWPALVSQKLNLSDVVITSDGSGYVTPGVGFATYEDLAQEVPADSAAVVVLGSDDDASKPYESIKQAALDTFATIRARAPHARILAIATFWVVKDPPADILKTRDAVRDAAQEADVQFVDPLADGWLVDDPSKTIGADGLHPTDVGQAELARRIAPRVASLLAE